MKISKTKLHQIIKEELRRVLGEGHDDLPTGTGSTIYRDTNIPSHLAGQRSDGRNAKKLPITSALSPAEMEQNELEDLAIMAKDQQLPADFEFASEKAGREVTPANPLTAKDLRKMVEPMSLEDRLRLTTTINLSLGRVTVAGPGSADAAYKQTTDWYLSPTGPGSEEEIEKLKSQLGADQIRSAETFAVDEIIKILKDEQSETHAALPFLHNATIPQIRELMHGIPQMEPELFKQAYNWYLKKFQRP